MRIADGRFAGLVAAGALVAGAAHAETRTYDLTGFDGVDVSAGIGANVRVGGEFAVSIEATEEDFERLRVEVKNGALVLSRDYKGMGWTRKREEVEATISMPALSSLEASSGSRIDASGVDAGRIRIEASSGADIEVAGRCEDVRAEASSGASLDAEALICARADADASSGASIRVHASDDVRADASSGGSIKVSGEPSRRDVSKSSGGAVRFE